MVKRVSSRDARANFSELLGTVYYTKEPVVVERKGKPYAVMISPELWAQMERRQHDAWAAIDRLRERNADKDPDAVLRDVTEVVEAVRQERYARQQRPSDTEGGR